jgi:hypothetical protein
MSIIDKNIKFVVENYDEILALQKIVKHTEKNLSDWLNKSFKQAVIDMDKFFDQQGLHLELEESDPPEWFYWYDPEKYDSRREIGPYFAFDYNKWDYIFDEEAPDIDKSANLYVELDMEEVGKKKKEALFKKIITKISNPGNIKVLKSNKIRICKDFNIDEPRIFEYSLAYDINMKTLNNNNLTAIIQNAIKRFTSSTLPIIRGLNGKLKVK